MVEPLHPSIPGSDTPGSLPQPANMWSLERAYEPPKDPLSEPANPHVVYRDLPTTVALEWSPDLVTEALVRHSRGYFDGSSLLLDAVMADPRVQATLHARTAGLLGAPCRFYAAQHRDQEKANEVMQAWSHEFQFIAPRATLGQFLYWGIGLGLAPAELRWDTSRDLWRPELKVWHPQFAWFNLVTRRYIMSTLDGPMEVDPGNGRWLLYTPNGAYRGWMQAAVRSISVPWLIWQLAQRDAARFSEVHGLPILKAVVPIGGDANLKKRFIEAASNLGQESVVMTPQGIDGYKYDLELLEATDRSFEAFFKLMDRCEQSITITLLGQNLTTQASEGSFAAARVHGDVKQTILEHDEATLQALIYEQIARPWALWNFGDADLAPRTRWDISPTEDQTARVAVLNQFALACQALSSAGVSFDPGALAKEFHLPIDSQPVGAKASHGPAVSELQAAVELAKSAGVRPTREALAGVLHGYGLGAEEIPAGTTPAAKLELAPTDLAKVVRVDEARASQGLPPIGDDRGAKTIPELESAATSGVEQPETTTVGARSKTRKPRAQKVTQ